MSNNEDTRVLQELYMGFSTAGGGPYKAEINITPMVDVLLVLIIVFMVVVSMSQEKGLRAEIPQSSEKPRPEPVRTIVIQIGWAGDKKPPMLKINDREVEWGNLHDRLFDIFKQRGERVAFVKGDDNVDFQ